ncbi:MAG: amino acid ABC transporter permease [Erysipelotrichaceae bacterium]|nr:amino acid ABC transporter permease [Erysipelotrichaceae bacterium]
MNERVWEILLDSFGKILLKGLEVTLPLTIASFAIAIVIGVVVALIQVANIKGLKQICRFYVWIIRGTPILVQLYVIFFGLPSIGIVIDPFPSALLVFGINTGAYASETIRAAIESIDKGQIEAGYCVGMTYTQIMARIVLPQALRVAFPSLFNILISLVKDTSLASSITLVEMIRQTQYVIARTYEAFWLYLEVGLIYLIFCTVLTKIQSYGEKKLSSYGGQ